MRSSIASGEHPSDRARTDDAAASGGSLRRRATGPQRGRKAQEGERLTLRLGVMCTIAPAPLLGLVDNIGRRHPDLDLEVVDSSARELEVRLKRDELEVAIYCRPDHPDDQLHYLKLFRERMMIVLAPTHHLANHDPIRFQELQNERYLNRINCEFNEGLAWEQCGVTWRAVYRSERDDWILAMCAAGMGFGFCPSSASTTPESLRGPIVEPEFWREVNVVTVRGRPHSPAVGALVREAMRTTGSGEKGGHSRRHSGVGSIANRHFRPIGRDGDTRVHRKEIVHADCHRPRSPARASSSLGPASPGSPRRKRFGMRRSRSS